MKDIDSEQPYPEKVERVYIGATLIRAIPVTLYEWKGDTADFNVPNVFGYMVTYEDGCISWSPADVFEKSYRPLVPSEMELVSPTPKKDYKSRLLREREQLNRKLTKLNNFICEEVHPEGQEVLLTGQADIMQQYLEILDARIELLK